MAYRVTRDSMGKMRVKAKQDMDEMGREGMRESSMADRMRRMPPKMLAQHKRMMRRGM